MKVELQESHMVDWLVGGLAGHSVSQSVSDSLVYTNLF